MKIDINDIKVCRENCELIYETLKYKIRARARDVAYQLRVPADHMESLLNTALINAIDSWDESKRKNCKFTSFFWQKCNLVILNETAEIRVTKNKWGRRSSEPSITYMGDLLSRIESAENSNDEGNGLIDIIMQSNEEEKMYKKIHYKDVFRKLIKLATPKTKKTLLTMYKGYMSRRDVGCDNMGAVGRKLGVSTCCVKNRFIKLSKDYEKLYGSFEENTMM